MATYKVIQDIEAEDKLLGPLTLKGFIYAAIAVVLAYINFRIMVAGGLGTMRWVVVLILALPTAVFGILALPLGRDQPTEVWVLSHVRFLLKPRRRIWDQSGISNLVTITAPKKPERDLTKNLSQSEVHSRLKTLAMTLDSRGWAVKNVVVNASPPSAYLQHLEDTDSDRLIGASVLAQNQPVVDIHASDDIMDEQNNPTAQHFEALMQTADADRKRSLISKFNVARQNGGAQASDTDFGFSTGPTDEDRSVTFNDNPYPDGDRGTKRAEQSGKKNEPPKVKPKASTATVTPRGQADKLELAQSGKAFKVSTLSQLANRGTQVKQIGPGEVEISLH